MCKTKDFAYVHIPKKFQKLFFVTYDQDRIPLHTAIPQILALFSFIVLIIDTIFSIVTKEEIDGLSTLFSVIKIREINGPSIFYAPVYFYTFGFITVYTAICDLFLRVLRKKK